MGNPQGLRQGTERKGMMTIQDFLDDIEEDTNESVAEEHSYIKAKKYGKHD